jgi:hypothetical protein
MRKFLLSMLLVLPFLYASAIIPGETLKVSSEPAGAEVQLNGRYVGKTPLEITVDYTRKSNFLYFTKIGHQGLRLDLSKNQKEVSVTLVPEKNK